ncbi:hypothetical protein ASG90_20425 [Nocardioides sp. Soil797]|nr:hypothetical protein ASG90_20425 [Nocardioides sp. Soil797]
MNVGDLVDAGHAEIKTGPFGTQLRASDYVESGRPVLNVRNVGFGDVRPKDLEYVDEATAKRLAPHLLKPNDIVFGRKGAVERHAFISDKYEGAMQGSDCIRLRVSEGSPMPARFITFALRTKEHQAWMRAFCSHGATMASLNQDIVRQIPLPEVDRATQDFAAAVLQNIDDLIANNRRRVEVLEEMARAIYREWFVKFRYPGHEDVPLVDSALGPIPEGWAVKTLAEVANVNRSSRKPDTDEMFKYLDITALSEREIGELNAVAGADAPGRARRVISPGDTVWATVRPNRRAHALVVAPGDDWIASTGLAVLTPTSVSSTLLFETVSTSAFSDWLVSRATGSAYPAVRANDFEEAIVVVPDTRVDGVFASRVAPMHELSWKLRAESSALAGLRDLLLPKLVTGEIDVSTLDLDALMEEAVAS